VGYSHQETFFRAFQRHFGCPPSCRRSFSDHMETEKRSRQTVRAKWQEKTSIQR
jgi:AraC-like DNA-binding protein